MIISANGLLFNEYGDTLLVRRDDTRTLAPPGGAVEIGELPPHAAEREVREETGLEVRAVRLVGLYYLPAKPVDYLFLCFRTLQRGGEIQTSPESPQVGFVKSYPLPRPVLAIHREQIERGIAHPGGPPYWGTHTMSFGLRAGNQLLNRLVYPLLALRRRVNKQPAFVPPPDWQVDASVIVRNGRGEILWTRTGQDNAFGLPTAVARPGEPPWTAAARAIRDAGFETAILDGLTGIYPAPDRPSMSFAFTAEVDSAAEPGQLGVFLDPGSQLESASATHVAQVRHAVDNRQETEFHLAQP